jgi:hypothetical protein
MVVATLGAGRAGGTHPGLQGGPDWGFDHWTLYPVIQGSTPVAGHRAQRELLCIRKGLSPDLKHTDSLYSEHDVPDQNADARRCGGDILNDADLLILGGFHEIAERFDSRVEHLRDQHQAG